MAMLTHQKLLLKYKMKKTERSIMNRMQFQKNNSFVKMVSLIILNKNRRGTEISIK
jgi:hypothetical protein